ncbi:hypothetical protein shim_10530 [Shimia sp. SK013]|uniref:hypothetical protein n=1 Tax=Shimia sp. SK013 TaxID=1389006 RepID=UPI0006B4D7E4|nr:hypothetical protein [Shimia sp. SK013]KPA22765.1 hypothetical protein shim_10530 [Shimia sp. SK013]
MPASFRIQKPNGFVYVQYSGLVVVQDTKDIFAQYLQHPDYAPGQKHLVDFSKVTGWDADYTELMAMQAKKAAAFMGHASQTLIVYYAPNDLSRSIAQMAVNSWEPFPAVVPVIQDTREAALSILGLENSEVSEILD